MKLKNSTIKDFAEALGETDELDEYRIEHYHKAIPKVSVRNNLKEIFLPIFELKEAVLEALEIFVNVFRCILYFTLFPIVVVMHCFYARKRIRILYLYLIKHRKEIKAYKKFLQESKEQK
ncbi:hypothetical protein [Campylobacter upsaliensis]|uniref:hypothetical protein n=1 Tax=Campylobacter upsaliensis TaxID=28080 RepID=UPI0022EA11E7|nr:hypothetical protein [Campylobacter upsaliensis]